MAHIRIGWDIGGVFSVDLAERAIDGGRSYLVPPVNERCVQVVAKIGNHIGPENQFVISRVRSQAGHDANWEMLNTWEFWARTRMPRENCRIFIDTREDEGREAKRDIALEFGITDMVDDRIQVLAAMPAHIRLVAFCPKPTELEQYKDLLADRELRVMMGWEELERHYVG